MFWLNQKDGGEIMVFRRKSAREAEWTALKKQEDCFLQNTGKNRQPFINRQLERFVPDKLSSALDLAFFKAFELVFEKRTVSWLTRSMPTPWV